VARIQYLANTGLSLPLADSDNLQVYWHRFSASQDLPDSR
jgi:hypothetical protein